MAEHLFYGGATQPTLLHEEAGVWVDRGGFKVLVPPSEATNLGIPTPTIAKRRTPLLDALKRAEDNRGGHETRFGEDPQGRRKGAAFNPQELRGPGNW